MACRESHHFYISFDTQAEGVRLSPRMLAQYPEEMTVVLQHQFWDLVVTEDGFEVGVSFGGVPERLAVPFAAIKGFFDPSVQFGLQFEEAGEPAEDTQEEENASGSNPPAEQKRIPQGRAAVPASADADPAASPDEGEDKPAGGGEVVRLDRFRKR